MKMLNPLFNPSLAVVALCVTISLFLLRDWWWRRRALTCLTSVADLLNDQIAGHQVEIRVDGAPAQEVKIIRLRVKNSGYQSIRRADFEEPVRCDCGARARILALEHIASEPPGLRPPTIIKGNEFEVSPFLLKRGEWVDIRAIVSDAGKISVSVAADVNTRQKEELDEDTIPTRRVVWSVLALLAALLVCIATHLLR